MKFLRTFFVTLLAVLTINSNSQQKSLEAFLSDTALTHASVSICIKDTETGYTVFEYNSGKSLNPGSILKLVTSAAALELLGPQYTFKTTVGYTGYLNVKTGRLKGDIVIKGGGDPALGSEYFKVQYNDFTGMWTNEIMKLGIKKIDGKIITDDSYFDFQPVPAKWLWEDAGNYYGAGAYGLSVFDNTYEIHLNTLTDSSLVTITKFVPELSNFTFSNFLVADSIANEGYVFAAPYSTSGWLNGKIPANMEDFILKASITDPPLFMAELINDKLIDEGVTISGAPSTVRLEKVNFPETVIPVTGIISPPLSEIIKVLNHESINLYAEHIIKELGKQYKNAGSTAAGIEVLIDFLQTSGLKTDGMYIVDGSGLSPLNAINTAELDNLLIFMKTRGKYFNEYLTSLPEAGKEGTLKNIFKDPVFDSRINAKSGSMTRVRSYAGYLTSQSGKSMVFSIIVNNFSGPSKNIIPGIESIIKEVILNN